MNLFDLFEGAIDDLEARRIEDLEMKMDDLTARAKATDDPKVKLALRHEFAKCKAERDSYYKLNLGEADRDAENIIRKVFSQLHVDGGGGNLSYILTRKAPKFDSLRDRYHDDVDAILTQTSPKELAQAAEELKAMYGKLEEVEDTNYTYTVFIDGTKEGTYGSKEEAKAVVKRKKEQAPGRTYTIRPKSRTSMSSIKRFQHNRDRNIDEDDLVTAEGFALDAKPDERDLDPVNKWKFMVRQIIADYIKNPQGLYHIAKQKGPNSAEATAYNQIMHPGSKIPLPPNAVTFEGYQDFNKVEPYAVCLAGKPVKKFDYYEQARRFHDNWKQKLYREGNKAKADTITLMPMDLDEAANPAQQAAIAINMKKHHQKPKVDKGDYDEMYSPEAIKIGNYFIKQFNLTNEIDQQLAIEITDNVIESGETELAVIKKEVIKYLRKSGTIVKNSKQGMSEDEQIDGMARGEVKEIIRNASTIQQALDQGVSLDGWMYSYVTTSNDHLNSVAEQIGNPDIEEAGMDWAAHKSTGPKFSGYLKGTDPAPTEFGNKSVGGMEEGIDGNMTVRSNPLSQPLRKRNYVAKNAQSSGAGKHNNNLKAAAARGQVKHKAKAFELDEMTDDEGAKLRKDAEAYATKQMTAPKKVEPKKSFMQQVGDKQIGMVKGAWKGLTGQLKEDDQVLQLQKQLIAKGAKISADGIMGPQTQAAMKQFGANTAQPQPAQTPTSGTDKEIQSIVKVGSGFNIVKTADGELQRRTGARNWRNNNPGNIQYSPYAKSKGAVGTDGRYAIFPTLDTGMAAKKDLLFGSAYNKLSIAQAITKYAPPHENNTEGYIQAVVAATKATPDTIMSQLNDAQKQQLLNAVTRQEGFKVGNIQVVPDAEAMAEGWKSTVAGAALAGAAALGAGGAHAGGISTTGQGFSIDDQMALNQQMGQRMQQQYDQAQQQKPQAPTAQKDLSAFGTEYLQKVADGQGGRAMVSVADAKAELAARANGTSQQAPAPVKAPDSNNGQYKSLGDYYKANPGVRESSDNFLSWAVRNGYNFTKDPAIYESARIEYKALVESKKKTLNEAKGLGKRVRVVSGPASGQTGTIGEVRNGAYQGAPKYYTVDLDNGGHVQVRKEALRLITSEIDESLKDNEYFVWTVYFDNGTSKRIKVKSDEFDPYAYYARKNQVVVNVDYNWSIHQ